MSSNRAGSTARAPAIAIGAVGFGGARADRRSEIAQIAARLFDEEGYHGASMERLANAAGIAKPTLYHYFSGKEEILYEIHQQFIGPLIAKQRARAGSARPASEQLRDVMTDIIGLMETHRGHVRVFFESYRELPHDSRQAVRAQRDEYYAMVESIITDGIAAGEMRSVDARLTTLAVFGTCNWAYQWFDPSGPLQATDVAGALWDTLFFGISMTSRRFGEDVAPGRGEP